MNNLTNRAPRRGRPQTETAAAHDVIIDTVYLLLQDCSVRDLTMEAIAKHAGVGKPTLYKWWPSKAALVLTMFRERIIVARPEVVQGETAEEAIQNAAVAVIKAFNGQLGRILLELIAEGIYEPKLIRSLFEEHIRGRRAANAQDIERGKANGELSPDTDPELVIDAVFGALYYRLLFRSAPLTEQFGIDLVHQVFVGASARPGKPQK